MVWIVRIPMNASEIHGMSATGFHLELSRGFAAFVFATVVSLIIGHLCRQVIFYQWQFLLLPFIGGWWHIIPPIGSIYHLLYCLLGGLYATDPTFYGNQKQPLILCESINFLGKPRLLQGWPKKPVVAPLRAGECKPV